MSKLVSINRNNRAPNNDIIKSISNTRANLLKIVMNNRTFESKRQAKILVVGLSGAGKSTLMEFIDKGAVIEKARRPTLAFTRYNINFGKLQMIFIDAPGQKMYWKQWNNYVDAADGILFMVDSANFRDVTLVNKLIYDNLQLHKRSTPTLFLANKQDLDSAIAADSINNLLKIREKVGASAIFAISAKNGKGILDAFKWLLVHIVDQVK